jgi:hypothetical protein
VADSSLFKEFEVAWDFEDEAAFFTELIVLADGGD